MKHGYTYVRECLCCRDAAFYQRLDDAVLSLHSANVRGEGHHHVTDTVPVLGHSASSHPLPVSQPRRGVGGGHAHHSSSYKRKYNMSSESSLLWCVVSECLLSKIQSTCLFLDFLIKI